MARTLKSGDISADVRFAGGSTVLRVTKGETISEALFKQLSSTDKKRFKKVAAPAPADADADETA